MPKWVPKADLEPSKGAGKTKDKRGKKTTEELGPEPVEAQAPQPEKQEVITSQILLAPSVGPIYDKQRLLRFRYLVFPHKQQKVKAENEAEGVLKKLSLCARPSPPPEIETDDASLQKAPRAEQRKGDKKGGEAEGPMTPSQTISLSQEISGAMYPPMMPPEWAWYLSGMYPPFLMGKGGQAPRYPGGMKGVPPPYPAATAASSGDAAKAAKGKAKAKAQGKGEGGVEGKGAGKKGKGSPNQLAPYGYGGCPGYQYGYKGMPPVNPAYAAAMQQAAHAHARAASGAPDQFASAVTGKGQPLDDVQKSSLRAQIEFYFSEANLCKDIFLRSHMSAEGWTPIELIAQFPKVRKYSVSPVVIAQCLQSSDSLEVDLASQYMRLKDEPLRTKWAQFPKDS